MFRMYDLIEKKKQGNTLTKEEIDFIINGYTKDEIPDYQMSAFLMAVYFQGMTMEEIADLTMAMANSGDMLDLSRIPGRKLDKHSTGGVGDKTTLIVGPIMAALGVPTAKMSGRGLGATGGTIDKLDSIPGFRSDLSEEEFISVVNTAGFSDVGQTKELAPADKKIYALRDVTATVDSIGLIASSIMSKKIASGADAIVLDVKCGSGAFMKDFETAKRLGETMKLLGEKAGRKCDYVISDMNEPLGVMVGNALEVKEAVEFLKGRREPRLERLVEVLCVKMLMLSDKGCGISTDEAREKVREVLENGAALGAFRKFIICQHGDPSFIDDLSILPSAEIREEVRSEKSGFIVSCNTEEIGIASMVLGGGRMKKEDEIDPAVGIEICRKIGDEVHVGDVIAVIYGQSMEKIELAKKKILEAYTLEKKSVEIHDIILG